MSKKAAIHEQGQSLWLNYLRRSFIESGQLREALDSGISGITSSPKIFEKAITDSADYDDTIQDRVAAGTPVAEIYQALVIDDIQRAADVLHPIFEMSEGLDGYVTVELDPRVIHDPVGTVAESRHLLASINRANVMVEIPATEAGIIALERLTSDGVNTNATHIFSISTYEKVAAAYLRGIATYIDSHSVWRQTPASVASVTLNRIDHEIDQVLGALGRRDLWGKTGISLAKVVYQRFCELFSGRDWERLAQREAKVQRPKWTRTTPRNFIYPDTLYVEALIGPDTVCTLSPVTLNAFRDHGLVSATLVENLDTAATHLETLNRLGIDLEAWGDQLQTQSLADFSAYFQDLIRCVGRKRDELEQSWQRMIVSLGSKEKPVGEALIKLCDERIMCRIWNHDHTVWRSEPEEITNRLGWLHIVESMQENRDRLADFATAAVDDGFRQAVVLGMGGSSLAPDLFAQAFGPWAKLTNSRAAKMELTVLDTTDPDAIFALERRLNLDETLFIVASKSGNTVETLALFNYFYNELVALKDKEQAGNHFVAITDPGTQLVDLAERHHFRDIFLNDPTIGGRYSALSYFGLVPAILVGVDIALLLDRALGMISNSAGCNCPVDGDNFAAQLGAILGTLALQKQDKLTLLASPAIAAFGDWIEQLIAESTGKDGQGIVPVVGEPIGPPEVYGADRIFVYLRLGEDSNLDNFVDRLSNLGLPVVILQLKDIYDLGGQFFIWEMATAVTAHILGINPFNQPDVEAAKIMARNIVAAYHETGALPEFRASFSPDVDLAEFLDQGRPGDYIVLQAFVPPTPETDEALSQWRVMVRDRTQLATTVGYGPRYLHSTGQLHKGDGRKGLFVQLLNDSAVDLPIPEETDGQPELTFGILKRAQALGDGQALIERKRRLMRINLGQDVAQELRKLANGPI